MSRHQATFNCTHCGEPVPSDAKVCRSCGASDECGWNDDDLYDTGLADDDDDEYSDFVYGDSTREQRPDLAATQAARVRMWVRLVILAMIVSFLLASGLF